MKMENIGLNNEVVAGGRKFHVQTQYIEPNEKVVSTIFDNGKVIVTKSIEVKSAAPTSEIKQQVNKLHQDMIADLELIFYISEKVRSIKHSASNNKLGLVFLKRNLYNEAITEFKRAIEIDQDFVEAYNNLGYAYLKQKSFQEAIKAFENGIDKDSKFADLHNNLGYAYFKTDKYVEAIHELQSALKINQNYIAAIINLCLVYLKTIEKKTQNSNLPSVPERMEKIKQSLIDIKEKDQYLQPQYIETALEHLENNNITEAIHTLEMAEAERLDLEYINIENEFYLKFMFGGKGKDDSFILDYTNQLKQAIAKHSDYADLRNNLGIAYLIQCRNLFLNALEEFRQALKINPEFIKAEKNLKLAENDGKGFLILLRAILK